MGIQAAFGFTIIALLGAAVATPHDMAGVWQGSVRIQTDTRYKFTVVQSDAGSWRVNAIIGDDWGLDWQADDVFVEGARIHFSVKMPGLDSAYDGELSADETSISGTWSINHQPLALKLVRATGASEWKEAAHRTKLVSVQKNVQLEVLDWGGTGRPVVLLAGLGNTSHVFGDFATRLAEHYHVYGVTRRGFGESSAPPVPTFNVTAIGNNVYELRPPDPAKNPYDADRLGDDVAAVLKALNLRQPILVGHSIGGEELTSVATRHPDAVSGLVYLDAFYDYAYFDGTSYDALYTADHPWRVTLAPGEMMPSDPGMAVLLGMHKYTSVPRPALAICAVPQVMPAVLKGNTEATKAYDARQQQIAERYARIEPTLPSVRIVRIQNSAHYVFQASQAEVIRQMNAFISSVPWLAGKSDRRLQ